MKKFDIPDKYRSSFISTIKHLRNNAGTGKGDFSPTVLDFGPVRFHVARHFGFCFGVENAIEKAYKILHENPGKTIYLLSEMIHNPRVNQDLMDMGIRFIQDTKGNPYIHWDEVTSEDIVIIPAFGSTIEIENLLKEKRIAIEKFDTTCPFVGRVWKRAKNLSQSNHTIIVHGKIDHEETRATFSHAAAHGHVVIVQNMEETQWLGEVINSDDPDARFEKYFEGKKNTTPGFKASQHLQKVGVVNQTTMLATETRDIANYIKEKMNQRYIDMEERDYFADTRDTLCYATSDNQNALHKLLNIPADLAVVVGGYKSANTTHLVELCERQLPTFFINAAEKIISKDQILHFDRQTGKEVHKSFIPEKEKVDILLTSGASCPDAVVEEVSQSILALFEETKSLQEILGSIAQQYVTKNPKTLPIDHV